MIRFAQLSKSYRAGASRRLLLDRLNLDVPKGTKVALLGRNGAGKSTLLAMIAGLVPPDSGAIHVDGTVSWPLGFAGSFANDLTGTQNTRFVARIYGTDSDALVDYVRSFAQLAAFMDMPVRTYSAGMRARLAFGLSMGLRFDWYLVDEVTAVGDAAFRRKSLAVFQERLAGSGLFMVSHTTATLRDYCRSGLVLDGGRAWWFDDVADAIAAHEAAME